MILVGMMTLSVRSKVFYSPLPALVPLLSGEDGHIIAIKNSKVVTIPKSLSC